MKPHAWHRGCIEPLVRRITAALRAWWLSPAMAPGACCDFHRQRAVRRMGAGPF